MEHAETKQIAVTMVHAKKIDVNVIQDMTLKIIQIVQVRCIKRSNLISSKRRMFLQWCAIEARHLLKRIDVIIILTNLPKNFRNKLYLI